MSIFLLPKSVIAEVDHLCRKFLWGVSSTSTNKSKLHLTSWSQVCLPKQYGGLGFKEGNQWNLVLLAKYLWAVSTKQDILWVKWVNAIYLKGKNVWDYIPPIDVSWYWRKIMKLRGIIDKDLLMKAVHNNKLKVSALYNLILNREKVPYASVIWCKLSVPKHRFILWQTSLQHLLTRDNLLKRNIMLPNDLCPICELHQESHDHLFFKCPFSQRLRQKVTDWLGNGGWPIQFGEWVKWMSGRPNIMEHKVWAASLAAAVYLIWWNRNQCVFNCRSMSVSVVFTMLETSLRNRIKCVAKAKLDKREIVFLQRIKLM